MQLASPIGLFRDSAFFRATSDVLVYRGANPEFQLTWRDRKGRSLGTVGEPGAYAGIALSPDAKRAIVVRENPLTRADQDLWLLDLDRATSVRFSAGPFLESVPEWSADGETVVFAVGNDGADLWAKPVTGAAGQRLLAHATNPDFRVNPVLTTLSATSDRRFLVFVAETRGSTQSDLWILPLQQNSRPTPLLKQEFDQRDGTISPDGGGWRMSQMSPAPTRSSSDPWRRIRQQGCRWSAWPRQCRRAEAPRRDGAATHRSCSINRRAGV